MGMKRIKRLVAVGIVIGGVGTAATVPAAAAATTVTVSFRGMQLKIPSGWKVYRHSTGDGPTVQVVTGTCPKRGSYVECDSFELYGPKAIKTGHEMSPYTGKRPWHPSTGVVPCPADDKLWWSFPTHRPAVAATRPAGRGHQAQYRAWAAHCRNDKGKRVSAFTQRVWHLREAGIVVVDVWDTPGLAAILNRATWR
jgi:hypothetical protein